MRSPIPTCSACRAAHRWARSAPCCWARPPACRGGPNGASPPGRRSVRSARRCCCWPCRGRCSRAVATAGAVGFVGLVAPHALRLLGLRRAPWLLPASALAGGTFVVLADAVARTIVAPVQLPVGVIAAAVGVPSFLALLLHGPRGAPR